MRCLCFCLCALVLISAALARSAEGEVSQLSSAVPPWNETPNNEIPTGNELLSGDAISNSAKPLTMNSDTGSWVEGFHWRGVNRAAETYIEYNGQLIVGGQFFTAGNRKANHVVAWDGVTWTPLGQGVNGTVYAFTIYDGKLVAGGAFTRSGDTDVGHVAIWDGAGWLPLGTGVNDTVYALIEYEGKLCAAGEFTQAGGVDANLIASWDGNGWSGLGKGLGGDVANYVRALAIYNEQLVVGGAFMEAGDAEAWGVATWDGSMWSNLSTDTLFDVLALYVYQDLLIATQLWSTADPVAFDYIGAWDGNTWSSIDFGLDPASNSWFYDVVEFQGQLVAGGLQPGDGHPKTLLVTWDGLEWTPLMQDGVGGIYGLCVFEDELYAAGSFELDDFRYAAKRNGQEWSPLRTNDGMGLNDQVMAATLYDGDLIAAGPFSWAGGTRANRIAAWDGNSWSALGSGLLTYPLALSVFDGKLIAHDREHAGAENNSVLAWNGLSWSQLGDSLDNLVFKFTVYEGRLIAGGYFRHAGTVQTDLIAAWDGSSWSPLGSGLGGEGYPVVLDVAVNGGLLYVCGRFTRAGDGPAHNIAYWDGSGWTNIGTSEIPYPEVMVFYDGHLIVAETNGELHVWDGQTWSVLPGELSCTGDQPACPRIRSMNVIDGKLFVTGQFTHVDDVEVNNIAIWDGSSWSSLGSGTNWNVMTVLPFNEMLAVAGTFDYTGNTVSSYIAFWSQEMALEVDFDVKPGTCPNPLNLTGNNPGKAVFPAAIIGTSDFDVRDIDPSTIMLEGIPAARWSYEDVAGSCAGEVDSCGCDSSGPDGLDDLTLKFYRSDISAILDGAMHGDMVPLTVTGMLYDGTEIEGTDYAWIRRGGRPRLTAANSLPNEITLYPNSPNPFNPVTRIAFDLPEATEVRLDIFNVIGQKVATIVNETLGAGSYSYVWDASDASTGLYFYRLTAGQQVETKKMLLLK